MDSPPPIVEDLALGAFRLVKQSLDLELDFSAETLPILDHYLMSLREDDGAPDEKVVSVVAPCAGAYFGEVARRTLGELSWVLPEEGHEYREWRLEGTRTSLSFNPIGAALEAIYGESLAEWSAHLSLPLESRALVDRALSATAPVREEDFYRLAIRHEVLEHALEVLRR
ncbi:MAG: hypothetical protein H6719_36445 [Sandaracinaceae bacterium]|nr:hypothetical protein [Sandaracinaceae bacterium]